MSIQKPPARALHAIRFAALGGVAGGLGASPLLGGAAVPLAVWLAMIATAACAAVAARRPAGPSTLAVAALLAGAAGLIAGLAVGTERLRAIDAGAYAGPGGRPVTVRGFVEAVPRRSGGEVEVRVQTADGRLALHAPEPVADLPVGREVRTRGRVHEPEEWERPHLVRQGIVRVVEARAIRLTGRRRGGIAQLTDRLRDRAQAALERGTPGAQAALLRGFVLGEDDRIDPATVEDFQRSGLAHLLAVSGQNVLLLALLASPLLGLLGVPLRARLVCVLALIALYVPVAGAGPSIQRAGVMGAAAIVAALASRPTSRWYVMLLAAAATLVLDPRASGDVGWQLSFAAVGGIALWTPALRDRLAGSARAGAGRSPGPRALVAEAAAVTIAATVATAPLMAHHFERLSVASLPANLIALPAVAPVMWLGMLAAAAGQLPWLPVEPLTALAGLCAGYIEQVARWLAAPGWAQVEAPVPDVTTLVAIYALLVGAGRIFAGWQPARRSLRPRRRWLAAGGAVALVAMLGLALRAGGEGAERDPGLRVTVLDVGQGDAILLDPSPGDPILVDTGPAGTEVGQRLRDQGVDRLAAAVITHAQSDHAGGLPDLLGSVPASALGYGQRRGRLVRAARAAGVTPTQLAEGSELRSGRLRLEVLWPPRVLLDSGAAGTDPNALSVVALARWGDFALLLTGDGEAESIPLDPGAIDVLKVAHHGSSDGGLERLLERSAPRLAVISVGDENPFGHPAPETLSALRGREVPVVRTDLDGEITIDVTREGWRVHQDG